MFGPRLSSLFTSRWMALLWGILICLTAIQFTGTDAKQGDGSDSRSDTASAGTDATGQPIKPEDVAAIRHAFGD